MSKAKKIILAFIIPFLLGIIIFFTGVGLGNEDLFNLGASIGAVILPIYYMILILILVICDLVKNHKNK